MALAAVGISGTRQSITYVVDAAARLGHLIEPDRMVDAVGSELTVVYLASASVHLDVKLIVDIQARQRCYHGSCGQGGSSRRGC